MVELARLIPAIFRVAFSDFYVGWLGNIELRAGRVVASKNRKGNSFQALGDDRRRIFVSDSVQHGTDVVDLEAEVIQSRGNARSARKHRETDETITYMTSTIALHYGRSDLFHP